MVELEGGETLRTPLVISNADVRQTFEELLDPESIDPRFMKRLRRMRPNCSAVVVQAATTLDLSGEDLASEVFRPLGYDADAEWQGIGQGRPGPSRRAHRGAHVTGGHRLPASDGLGPARGPDGAGQHRVAAARLRAR